MREPLVGVSDELQREKKVEEEEEVCQPIVSSPMNLACDLELCPKDSFSAPTKHFAGKTRGETRPRAIGSRFWVPDGEDSEEEEEHACHGEEKVVRSVHKDNIVRRAMVEGFTIDEILSAGEYLLCTNSSPKAHSFPGSTRIKGNNHLVDRLVAAVCSKKVSMCKPWKGLPPRRVSQPKKLETFLSAALEDWQRKKMAGLGKTPAKVSKGEGVNASAFSGNLDNANTHQGHLFYGQQLAQEDEASVYSSLLHDGINMDGPSVQIGKGDRGVNVKFYSGLGRLLSHAGRHSLARKEHNKGEIERSRLQSQLGINIRNREGRQRGGEEGGVCAGGELQVSNRKDRKEVQKGGMARRKEEYDGCSNRGWGAKREEEEGFGAGFQGNRMGFDPGYGFGQRGSFGQRWQRHGYHPRGARSFGPWHGGFAGRSGRRTAREFGTQCLAFERKMDDMGRKGEEMGGAAISERIGGAGRVKVGEVEVLVPARKVKQPMERKTKRAKNDDMVLDDKEEGEMEGKGGDDGNQGREGVQENIFGEMASKIIDGAVLSLLEEVCDKVMHEEGQPAMHEGEVGQQEVEGGGDKEQGDGGGKLWMKNDLKKGFKVYKSKSSLKRDKG
uniref:Uncharacterized protein n=1 Tax=Oryza punctata TaxID=4537 RepID=A0A0E0K0W6_ORYPU